MDYVITTPNNDQITVTLKDIANFRIFVRRYIYPMCFDRISDMIRQNLDNVEQITFQDDYTIINIIRSKTLQNIPFNNMTMLALSDILYSIFCYAKFIIPDKIKNDQSLSDKDKIMYISIYNNIITSKIPITLLFNVTQCNFDRIIVYT